MKQASINVERAKLAEKCLAAGEVFEMGPGIECGITDILTYIRHLCDRYDLDYETLNDLAGWHYGCQIEPDDCERDTRYHFRQQRRSERGGIASSGTSHEA